MKKFLGRTTARPEPVCVAVDPEPVVKTATQLADEDQRRKVHDQLESSRGYPTTYDRQGGIDGPTFMRPTRTAVNAGATYLTAINAQRDQWQTSMVKGGGRDATRFTQDSPWPQHNVRKGPEYIEGSSGSSSMKRHDASTAGFFGARDRVSEMKRAAPRIEAPLQEDPATNRKERLRPVLKTGTEYVYGTDVGGGAQRGMDFEAFSHARDRQYTVSTLATRAGTEYKSKGLGAGGGRQGAGQTAPMADSYLGARLPGTFAREPGVAQARTTAPTDFADVRLATERGLVTPFEINSRGMQRKDAALGTSLDTDFTGGARYRDVGNFQMRGFGGVGRAAGSGAVSGVENKGWIGSRLRLAEADPNVGRMTVGNGQVYGGSTTYGNRGGFNKDRSRAQEIGVNRYAVGAPAGLFAGPEVNLQQGGRHPITGSMQSKQPIAGKRNGTGTSPDGFGLPDSCPHASTLFTPELAPRSYGGGSLTGTLGVRTNEARPIDSAWDSAKSDMDGSKRSRIIQAQVQDSVSKMKAFSEMGLVIR